MYGIDPGWKERGYDEVVSYIKGSCGLKVLDLLPSTEEMLKKYND
jgi:hypothetical protein